VKYCFGIMHSNKLQTLNILLVMIDGTFRATERIDCETLACFLLFACIARIIIGCPIVVPDWHKWMALEGP
jgi:hypothetical protein